MPAVISVENLSKSYRLGQIGTGRLANDLKVWWARTRGKPDPFLKIGQVPRYNQSGETIWALKDMSFKVQQGEVLGIIGRNGAGKSTLLKILSRVTAPTKGEVKIKGRIASLLEVGTGFHPELTGRENIYLNGAILGMRKMEVARKFEEIVDFSGVEKFIDTPVKRYSSGMYVRLAFAVAAHLDSEILIVDEVLAVGDAEFQKKCLQRMDLAGVEGRTVLFVSHNMVAIRSLCNRSIWIQDGSIAEDNLTELVQSHYLNFEKSRDGIIEWDDTNAPRSQQVCLVRAYISTENGDKLPIIYCNQDFSVVLEYDVLEKIDGLRMGFELTTPDGTIVCGSNDPHHLITVKHPGRYEIKCRFPKFLLNTGVYYLSFGADVPPYSEALIRTEPSLRFMMKDIKGHGPEAENLPGILRPALKWETIPKG